METKQFNLKLPKNFVKMAEDYAKKFGFRNIQELATVSMREKISENVLFADEKLLSENWLSEEDNQAWKDL
ncbi:MAG: hypothetical protein PHH54_01895 [Candidatus Nanoarchaeia archaeon]|nr:hypothetical protein [Candidatus Nanoarchaeia archaeon]MDD5740715.1 hypothetical protein [Candidatus Nanoarchaeia archaeon]